MFTSPYFETIAIAEIIQPSVTEAVEAALPSLIPPYVDQSVLTAVQQYSVLLTGSTMSGPLFLSPLMPTAPSQAATMAYVDAMLATAGIPEVPPVPTGQIWARETGQWVPISQSEGTFLPLAGGTMGGSINMSGNTITNMAAVPAMPNGAAPAQWVLNQIASVSLYQGTWDADTNTPDLTQLSTHVNAYTWIAITTSVSGVVIGPAIPGLQGLTIYNGDTIIYSTAQGQFSAIHAGGLTLPEADARYVQLAGSQMSGTLLLNANATQNMQAVTFQQLEAAVANTVTPDAPADGQAYLRVGVGTNRWVPGLPLAGGILTGSLTLAGNATTALMPVPLQQMTSAITAGTAGLLPIAGGTMTGPIILAGNAATNLNPVPLQQLNSMLGTYATQAFVTGGFLPLSGGTLTGNLTVNGTVALRNAAVGIAAGGLWRTTIEASGNYNILQNTAAAGDFSTGFIPATFGPSAADSITFNANITAASNITAEGNITAATNLFAGNSTYPAGNAATSSIITHNSIGGFRWQNNGGNYSFLMQDSVNPIFVWLSSTLVMMSLDGGGNLVIGGTLTQGSDANNKTNMNPLTQGVSLVRQLIPKSFSWLTSPEVTHWGFIAQDVEGVIPEAVSQQPGFEGTQPSLALDITGILAAVAYAVKQNDQRLSAVEAELGITPPPELLA